MDVKRCIVYGTLAVMFVGAMAAKFYFERRKEIEWERYVGKSKMGVINIPNEISSKDNGGKREVVEIELNPLEKDVLEKLFGKRK